jgi:integrase
MSTRGYGSGSLREKRPGVWELRVAGRSKTVRGGRKEAERALAAMVTATPGGKRPRELGVTLGRLLDEWLTAARIEASTRSTYEAALAHLPPAVRKVKLDALELRTFDRLYSDLERAGVSVHQIRKLHTVLSSALTAAVRWQYVAANPARGARLPELPRRQVKAPPTDVVVRLLAAADDLQATIWLRLALATGARRGEVLALRWPAVDLDAGTVTYAASMNEDRTVKVTKTNRERTITLDPGTVAALRSWRALQVSRALELGVKASRSCYVLSNALDGSIPWRPDGASQRFRRLRARAGVGDVRLHDLRHANATLMLRNGVDPMTAAYRLGHSRPTTTMDVYGHVIDGADRAAADTIGRLLG